MIVYNYPSFFGVFSEMFSSFVHSLRQNDKSREDQKPSERNRRRAAPRRAEFKALARN